MLIELEAILEFTVYSLFLIAAGNTHILAFTCDISFSVTTAMLYPIFIVVYKK